MHSRVRHELELHLEFPAAQVAGERPVVAVGDEMSLESSYIGESLSANGAYL